MGKTKHFPCLKALYFNELRVNGNPHKVCDKELGDDMTNKCKEKYGKNNPNLYACMAQAAIYKNVLYGVGGIAFESAQDEHCIWKCCEKEKK